MCKRKIRKERKKVFPIKVKKKNNKNIITIYNKYIINI